MFLHLVCNFTLLSFLCFQLPIEWKQKQLGHWLRIVILGVEFSFNKQLLQPAHFLFSSYETHRVRPKFENFLLSINYATNVVHMSMSTINFNFFYYYKSLCYLLQGCIIQCSLSSYFVSTCNPMTYPSL